MSKRNRSSKEHLDPTAATRRRETPALEGREPLPEELTGRASGTSEDLETLFENDSAGHLTDGFRGGSDDDDETDVRNIDAVEVDPAPDDDGPVAA
ncbi:MAG: hypothetical protein V4503_08275 [Gemmatimonadota bacterium]